MVMVFLAVAVSPISLSAAKYYTKAIKQTDVYAVKDVWFDVEGNESGNVPSPENDYYVVTNALFKVGGRFGGDSLSLGLPSDIAAPEWAIETPAVRLGYTRDNTYTINDFRLYSGKLQVQSQSMYDATIAGTTTVYSANKVELIAYRNASSDSLARRSINLASTLKGESGTSLMLTLGGNSYGSWPELPTFIVLSGDFSEYHGSFYVKGGLLLLNTPTAFGCEVDGAKANVYTVSDNVTMSVAADKSTLMSCTRGITISANKTLTLTTTNDFDGVSYSEYTVVFPISGDASTTLVKSGEGNIMLDSDCNVGMVRVDSGTLALGTNFVSSTFMPSLVLAVGAQIELADGVRAEFLSATFGTDTLAPGFYTGTGGSAYATAVSWISGAGTLLVRPSEPPTAAVADTWKAAGGAGTMSAASSWVGESAPNLETGEFLPTFADAGSGAVVDADSVVKGIVFDAPNDFALTGLGVLTVLNGGITAVAAERRYTISVPLVAALSQTWSVGENATLALEGNFVGSRSATVTKTGSGTLDISGTNDYPGALSVTDGRLRLSGVFGSSAGTDGVLSLSNSGGTGITLAGVTINKPVTHQVKNVSDDLVVAAATTNVFNGRVTYSRSGNIECVLGDGAAVIYNDGLSVTLTDSKVFSFTLDEPVTTSPFVRFRGRPSVMTSFEQNVFKSFVTSRFEVPGNKIMKYQQTGKDRLEATVDYAWNGIDGIGDFILYGKGSVIDVGSTRQCIRDITIYNNREDYYAVVSGNGGTLELAPTADLTLALNQMRFGDAVSLQKHGTATLILTNKTESVYSLSYGDVSVTNGVLEFAAGVTWLNGTNVTVSGSGTLKLNTANTFNREHAVIRFADNGAINVPSGVTQVFAEGWDGESQMRGTYKSGSSSRVTGGGAIRVGDAGFMIVIK